MKQAPRINNRISSRSTRVVPGQYVEMKSTTIQPMTRDNSPCLDTQPRTSSHIQRRIFNKDGAMKITRLSVSQRHCRYLKDFFTTLLDFGWIVILLLLSSSFVLSWLIFAGFWYLMMHVHGDFEDNSLNSTHVPCVAGVTQLSGIILFSIETQQTIGYGTRSVTQQCSSGVILLMIQTCFGLIIQSLWVGVAYSKLTRPTKRRRTVLWSHQAVISLRDQFLTLQVRIADLRQRSTLIEAHIRMYFISKRVTGEGEVIPLNMTDMNVGFDIGRDRLLLLWPVTIEHRIDSKSPLWRMDKRQLASGNFEILVVFEGVIESTGLTTQARTSYVSNEIVWGARFNSVVRQNALGHIVIDYSQFHSIKSDDRTPVCSGQQLQSEY